jgi:hypothetical protein
MWNYIRYPPAPPSRAPSTHSVSCYQLLLLISYWIMPRLRSHTTLSEKHASSRGSVWTDSMFCPWKPDPKSIFLFFKDNANEVSISIPGRNPFRTKPQFNLSSKQCSKTVRGASEIVYNIRYVLSILESEASESLVSESISNMVAHPCLKLGSQLGTPKSYLCMPNPIQFLTWYTP